MKEGEAPTTLAELKAEVRKYLGLLHDAGEADEAGDYLRYDTLQQKIVMHEHYLAHLVGWQAEVREE